MVEKIKQQNGKFVFYWTDHFNKSFFIFVSGEASLKHILRKDPLDVVFVDEAHLLWTQGKQAKKDDNYLELKEQLRIQAGKEMLEWIYFLQKISRSIRYHTIKITRLKYLRHQSNSG